MIIYTDLTKEAMRICFEAHAGQVDKSGMPYVLHPIHVAETVEGNEVSVAAALLHDVVEDSDFTFEDLKKRGIPDDVISVLRLLTHDGSMSYDDYIDKISCHPIATAVKLADLKHNMDTSRYDDESEVSVERQMKYERAHAKLSEGFYDDEGEMRVRLLRAEANTAAAMASTDDPHEAAAYAYAVGLTAERYARRRVSELGGSYEYYIEEIERESVLNPDLDLPDLLPSAAKDDAEKAKEKPAAALKWEGKACPRCQSDRIAAVVCKPDDISPELFRALSREDAVIGYYEEDMPQGRCLDCGLEFMDSEEMVDVLAEDREELMEHLDCIVFRKQTALAGPRDFEITVAFDVVTGRAQIAYFGPEDRSASILVELDEAESGSLKDAVLGLHPERWPECLMPEDVIVLDGWGWSLSLCCQNTMFERSGCNATSEELKSLLERLERYGVPALVDGDIEEGCSR